MFFYLLDYQAQECIFDSLLYELVNGMVPWWSRVSDNSLTRKLYSHGSIINILIAVLSTMFAAIKGWLSQSVRKALLLLVIFFLFAFLLPLLNYISHWYTVVELIIHPIQENIASGDWSSLIDSCNAISRCAPERRPIVIVRELTNFNSESLNAFLQSLEQMKEGNIHYPVFMESSDFQWVFETPVVKSRYSFSTYLLQEMTREEGLGEVVYKLKIWTEEEYQLIYDTLGGHLGSYMLLYHHNKVLEHSLNESIRHLKKSAYDSVLESVEKVRNYTAVCKWLLSLKSNSYIMTVAKLPEDILMLSKMNILFRSSDYVYPQNRLLEHAIDDFIHKFLDIDPQ